MLHYSKQVVPKHIGLFVPGEGKKIQAFKFKSAGGRSELIRGCAAGGNVKKYFQGWCSFIKMAKAMNGAVCKIPVGDNDGIEVDVFLITGNDVVKVEDAVQVNVASIDAVACLPKDNEIFNGVKTMDLSQFINNGERAGASLSMQN